MRQKTQNTIHVCLRIALGGVFLWASWGKIAHPEAFARILGNYQLLPDAVVTPVAILLPWVEAICGLCLVAGWGSGGAALIVNAMLLVFIAALTINLIRGVDVNCGCFSLDETATSSLPLEIARDALMLAAGSFVLIGEYRAASVKRPQHRSAGSEQ